MSIDPSPTNQTINLILIWVLTLLILFILHYETLKDFVQICILAAWAILLITITAWPALGQIDSVPTASYEDNYDYDTNYHDVFSIIYDYDADDDVDGDDDGENDDGDDDDENYDDGNHDFDDDDENYDGIDDYEFDDV